MLWLAAASFRGIIAVKHPSEVPFGADTSAWRCACDGGSTLQEYRDAGAHGTASVCTFSADMSEAKTNSMQMDSTSEPRCQKRLQEQHGSKAREHYVVVLQLAAEEALTVSGVEQATCIHTSMKSPETPYKSCCSRYSCNGEAARVVKIINPALTKIHCSTLELLLSSI